MVGRYWRVFLLALCALMPALAGPQLPGDVRIEEVEFVSHGATLSGSLVLPRHGQVRAAVVFIHGSGKQTRNMTWAGRFASEGIAALVYDKRGVGKSGGEYEGQQNVSEKNISLLADDAVSALSALASHPSLKGVPLGLTGISQAGWIAPLAAHRSRLATFLVLWSGPVCKVSEEDIFSKYTADAEGQTVPSYQQALGCEDREIRLARFPGKRYGFGVKTSIACRCPAFGSSATTTAASPWTCRSPGCRH